MDKKCLACNVERLRYYKKQTLIKFDIYYTWAYLFIWGSNMMHVRTPLQFPYCLKLQNYYLYYIKFHKKMTWNNKLFTKKKVIEKGPTIYWHSHKIFQTFSRKFGCRCGQETSNTNDTVINFIVFWLFHKDGIWLKTQTKMSRNIAFYYYFNHDHNLCNEKYIRYLKCWWALRVYTQWW